MSRRIDKDYPDFYNPRTAAQIARIVKRVVCKRCNVPFFESYNSTRKHHVACEPPETRKKRMSREVNN